MHSGAKGPFRVVPAVVVSDPCKIKRGSGRCVAYYANENIRGLDVDRKTNHCSIR